MFVDCPTFSGSWGYNLVGKLIYCMTIHFFIKHSLGRKFVSKGIPKKSKNIEPQRKHDSPVCDDTRILASEREEERTYLSMVSLVKVKV